MKECPRCHKMTLNDKQVLNSLSKRNNQIFICNECGTNEDLIDAGIMPPGKLEYDFVAAVAKQTK